MGNKGYRNTSISNVTAIGIATKLESIARISSKKMFGGNDLFCNKKMFAIVDPKGQGFLKVDDSNKADFEKHYSLQHSRMPYYSFPKIVFNKLTLKSIKITK